MEKEARLKFTKVFCCRLQFGNSKLVKFALVKVSKDINYLLVKQLYTIGLRTQCCKHFSSSKTVDQSKLERLQLATSCNQVEYLRLGQEFTRPVGAP